MKKISFAAFIAGSLFLAACNGNSSTTTTSDSTATGITSTDTTNRMNSNDTMNTTSNAAPTVGSTEQDFAKDAAVGGMMEVQLGNIAEKNSSTKSIQDFGKMMVDDHTKINDQLKDIASKKNIALPSMLPQDKQDKVDKLSKETGKDFDKDYVDMMVDDHKKDIDAFKKAGDKMTDPDLKDFVIKSLPTLQKHLDAIQAIKKKM